MKRRVVITGIGLVTPIGCGSESVWNKLLAGKCGVQLLKSHLITAQCPASVGASIPNGECVDDGEYDEAVVFGKINKDISTYVKYALYASDLALQHAKIMSLSEIVDLTRAGTTVGTGGVAAIREIAEGNANFGVSYKKLSPYFVPKVLSNMASGHVSIRHGLRGPVHSVATACAAGCHSIGDAFNFIRLGYADLMLAGGADAMMDPLAIAGFARMKALSTNTDVTTASRPFSPHRNGFVIGEGAGMLVLEELSSAQRRNAPIIAEIVGYGLSGDAFHSTSPSKDGSGAQRCMDMALRDAGIAPGEVGYVNAHATSTPMGDAVEVRAIHQVFSADAAQRSRPLLVSSTKGATGHLLGAAGAVEAAFAAMAVSTGQIPGTLGLSEVDPDCEGGDVFHHVPLISTAYGAPGDLRYSLSNSFGFGGTNAALVFKHFSV